MTTTTSESRTEIQTPATTLLYKGAWMLLSLAALAISGFAGIANAAPVAVTNSGFEDPVLGDGGNSDAVPGWTETETSAVASVIVNPTNDINAYDANVYRSNGSELVQVVGTVEAGTYTLTAEIGGRPAAAFGSYEVQLVANDGTTATVLATDSSAIPNSAGTTLEERFATSTATAEVLASDAVKGQSLEIRLIADPGEVNFDNVSLDFVPGPDNVAVYFKTERFNKPLPGGGGVAMWGFAACTDDTYTDCTLPTDMDAPGPQIDAFAGYNLTISVMNTLPLPVSIMIPGQVNAGVPTPGPGARLTSFAAEIAAPGGTEPTTGSYTFSALKAGTYIYQSASYPSIQVPMGLYGGVIVHQDATTAYPGVSAATDSLLLFSEIDPIQNNRVDAYASTDTVCVPLDDYNLHMTAGMPCTIDYSPMYFFINGEATVELPAGNPGDTALLRFANAGLHSHTPAIVGVELGLIAEDGNLYPVSQQQSAALLAAGKTLDALVSLPAGDVTLSLFDRMPTFSNENVPNGGSLGGLVVGNGSVAEPPPVSLAANDAYDVIEDTDLVVAAPGVLGNDTGLTGVTSLTVVGGPANGQLVLDTDGSFTYTPDPDYSGPDSFTYNADGNLAQVSLNVSFVNDAPVAMADGPYFNGTGDTITVPAPGILGNDADADGDALTAVIVTDTIPAPAGLTLNENGSLSYTVAAATASSTVSFQYQACDGTTCSAPVNVTLDHNPVAGISLTVTDDNNVDLPVDGYRWLVEEDAMWQPDPTATLPDAQSLATNFHRSHMPVVAQGIGATEFANVALDPSKHYFVSVLPLDAASGSGHTIGGARILPGADAVNVRVNNHELPTAQISIFIFEDNSPTNGAVDGNERGLGGFQITVEDAGGRYGAAAGTLSQDAFGQPLTNALDCFGASPPAPGIILSCPDTEENRAAGIVGEVLIKNLYQGKYGIITSPPLGSSAEGWVQTSTIEGTKVIDAWVKAGEPAFFQEFGPAGWHVFVGFVSPPRTEAVKLAAAGDGVTNSVSGNVTNMHMSRPPDQRLFSSTNFDALAHTQAWVGINSANGTGANFAAVKADENGAFTIDGLPDGDYQIVVWDAYLDVVIAYKSVLGLTGGAARDVGEVPVFQWFTRSEHNVFLDDGCGEGGAGVAGDGIRQPCETGIPEQNVNLRWRDGTINQAFPTDTEGYVPFDETFPFFHWQVLEVDYARFKPTGVTVTVDGGGELQGSTGYVLRPQTQVEGCTTAECLSRTETGPVLTQGFQGFLGQTSMVDWGKVPYQPGDNGGISGIVYYASTRAENDPQLAVGEVWEPGVPSVTVRLYREVARDPSLATPILINNAGFEEPALADGGAAPVSGWVETGTGEIVNPTNNINAYDLNVYRSYGSTLTQTTSAALEAGTYTLSVEVGGRPAAAYGSYQLQLGVETTGGFVPLAVDNNSQVPNTNGTTLDERFATATVSYTAAADDPYLGTLVAARLIATDEVNFDNVTLSHGMGAALAIVAETQTDSWDQSLPEGCPGAHANDVLIVGPGADGVSNDKCYDGLRNFNQVRPAVFDGGYAFGADGELPPGKYVVEVVPPAGYELVKEEDNNVGFGDSYYMDPAGVTFPGGAVAALPDVAMVEKAMAITGLAQPRCVGERRTVPGTLSLFPGEAVSAPFANATRPLCDRKEVLLSDQGQAAADFFLFTSTPVSGHFVGMILDDTAQEFNPLSPQFGEKWAPPFVPVSVRDHLGNEISRVYSDQWGRMNGLLPSTFTANMPSPSGYAPAMLMTCMNDPGPVPDPANPDNMITDPQYNPAYSNFCYTFQYMPGTTTYLDTPVLPVSAFASGYYPPDCEPAAGTPRIRQVDGPGGPGPLVAQGETLTIYSQGMMTVSNPAYGGPLATGPAAEKTITRDFGFGGTEGVVTLNGVALNADDIQWMDGAITWSVPADFADGDYQLVVTNSAGMSTTEGVTVTVGAETPIRVAAGGSIQAAIDNAASGDLILVGPGSFEELVILWKPVRLQGAGPGATFINGVKRPTDKILGWRTTMDCLFGIQDPDGPACPADAFGVASPLPNQLPGAAGFDTEEGAAITVVGPFDSGSGGPGPVGGFRRAASRIDGFSITGGDTGGGIFVNGYAHGLAIGNNRIFGNSGSYHGGIRIGRPFLELLEEGPYGFNRNVNVHHNAITRNGGLDGAGGGLSINTGTDAYTVSENFMCGNFTLGDGGGIGHFGLSNAGVIANNRILFNQSFNQGQAVSGGGVFIGGEPAAAGELTQGAGDITIDSNLIKGNQAGAGHGGGIRTQFVNGRDFINARNAGRDNKRLGDLYRIDITNNIVVDNVAGWSGGGISMQDTAFSGIVNNTIAHNDSTATVGSLIIIDPVTGDNTSQPLPAGVSTEAHSALLNGVIPNVGNTAALRDYSNPDLIDNIVWRNRAFSYLANTDGARLIPELNPASVGGCDAAANYWDLGVLGGTGTLNPTSSVLTDTTGYDASNTSGDPAFIDPYCNGARVGAGPMFALPALDEGGNAWIEVRFGPLVPMGDYHIGDTSSALDNAVNTFVNSDFDGDARPQGAARDRGADELVPPPAL